MVTVLKLVTILSVLAFSAARSPTGGYAPGQIDCPAGKLTRKADSLNRDEQHWILEHNKRTNKHLKNFLANSGLDKFDAEKFISKTGNRPIKMGISFSGGGTRAMLGGAGQLAALDNRTPGVHDSGLGELLQATSYITGLSGSSWLLGSLAFNNFTSVQNIVDRHVPIWDFSKFSSSGFNPCKIYDYLKIFYREDRSKTSAGFPISLTDIWSRAVSRPLFISEDDYYSSHSWSDIADLETFREHEMPFPIVVVNGRAPHTTVDTKSAIFEILPFELGSWGSSFPFFTKTKYLGLKVLNGEPSGRCVAGFDQAGFIMATSSSLFNKVTQYFDVSSIPKFLWNMIWSLFGEVDRKEGLFALYNPNPFKDIEGASDLSIAGSDTLYLVDGGENLQNVPLNPLIQPEREIDFIWAFDNSADTRNFPNGASLVATFESQFTHQGEGTIFPHVPGQNTFINRNLTSKPVFFGCDAKNLSTLPAAIKDPSLIYKTPVVAYIANRPFTFWSNRSTSQLSYDWLQVQGMIKNGYEVTLRMNNTLDPEWPACVACAIIRRGQERQGDEQSDQCKRCFEKYCWDGILDTSPPKVNFTSEGTTNGPEEDGVRIVSDAFSLTFSGKCSSLRLLGTCLLAVIACTFTAI